MELQSMCRRHNSCRRQFMKALVFNSCNREVAIHSGAARSDNPAYLYIPLYTISRQKKKECTLKNRIKNETQVIFAYLNSQGCGSSPRAISIAQLNTLLCLHLRPIKLVVCKCPYSLKGMGYLISRCASCLDAFSVYHIRTRLFCYALGRTTDAPEVRSTRSSRTKVNSSQISNAHDR